MSTIMTTSPHNASAVMQRLLAVALIAFAPFFVPAHATDLGLGYDANGNVNSRTTPLGTTTFNYDALDRVQNEAGPAGARTHVYDPNGNRTSDTAGTTAAYTPNTDKLQTINGITVTLDANGNLTRDGTYIYVWNALNQLAELHKADNTLIASYYYDYQNRRSRKVTTTAAPQGASTTYYTYDQQNHLIAETGPGNQPIATYVWNGDTLTGFITYQPTRTVYTVQVDQLGSPFQVRTLAGTVVWRWESEAYGKTQPNQDVDGDGTQLTLNLRFPGQYYDQESGLHYNLNRYYSPKLARYLTPDPIGLAGGANVFAYVGGNPLSYIDPYGLWVWGDPLPQGVVDFSAGFGDTLSLGATNWARNQMGTNGAVDKCSGAYSAGEWTGIGFNVALGGALGWEAAGAKGAGKEFSHWVPNRMGGPRSKWNGNFVPTATHALSDPYRYRFMPRVWKAENPMPNQASQQWSRIPDVYKGAAAGGAYGAAGNAMNGDCTCRR